MSETQQNPEIDFKTTKAQLNLQKNIREEKIYIKGNMGKNYEGTEFEAFGILVDNIDSKQGQKNYARIKELANSLKLDQKETEQAFEEGLYCNLKSGYRMKLYESPQDKQMIDQILSAYTLSFRQTLNNLKKTKNNKEEGAFTPKFILDLAKKAYILEPNIFFQLTNKFPDVGLEVIKRFVIHNPGDTEGAIKKYQVRINELQEEYKDVDLGVIRHYALHNPGDAKGAIEKYQVRINELQEEYKDVEISIIKRFALGNPGDAKGAIKKYLVRIKELQEEYKDVDLSVIKYYARGNPGDAKGAIEKYQARVKKLHEEYKEVDVNVIKHYALCNPGDAKGAIKKYQVRLAEIMIKPEFNNVDQWILNKAAIHLDTENYVQYYLNYYKKISPLFPYKKPEDVRRFVSFIAGGATNKITANTIREEDEIQEPEEINILDLKKIEEEIEEEWEKQLIAGEKLTPAERQTNNVFGSLRFTLTLVEEFCQNEALKLYPEKKQHYEKVGERINKILKFTSYLQNEDERFLYHDQKQELEHQKKHPNDKVSIFTPLGNWLNNSEYKFVNIMIRPDAYLGNSKNGDSEPRLKITFTPKQKEAEQFSFRIDIDSDSGEIVFDLEVLKDIDSQLINLMDHLEFEEKDTSRDMIKNIFTHHFNSNISTRNGLPKFKEIMEEFVKVFQKNKNHTPIKLN